MNLIARSARSLVALMILIAAAAPHPAFAQATGDATQGSFGPGGFLEHPFTMTVQGIGQFITHPVTTTGTVLTNIGTAIQNFSSGFTTQGPYGNASLNERQGNPGTNGTANNATPAGPTTVTTGYIVGRTQNNITSGINTFLSNPFGQVTRAINAVGHVVSNTASGISRFFGVSNQPAVVGSNGTVYGNNPIGQIHRAIDSVARGADYAVRVLTGTNTGASGGNTTSGDGNVASPTSNHSSGGSGSGTTGTNNPDSTAGGAGPAGTGGAGNANVNVGGGGAGSVRQGAVYDGHGNTSVGGVIYSHVGPLSGSESTGGRSEDDPIDTGGAGDPNNGAGENNAGMNPN